MSQVNVRELVVESLITMDKEGTYLSTLEQMVLDKYDYLDTRDKAFYKRVLSGTVERKIRIDYILGLFSDTKINKMKPLVRALLRSSIYQIMWMDSVPDRAVCNEAVSIVSKRKMAGLKGFVNGVLRNICRNKDNIQYPDPNTDRNKYYSVYYSCPEWIVEKFIKEVGDDNTHKILEATMKEHPVMVRLRRNGLERMNILENWRASGVKVEKIEDMDDAYMLRGVDGVASLDGYYDGAFVVQDYGSMMVARLAGIKAGDCVMDVCAAPGGKSMHAADILLSYGRKDKGQVYSYDLTEEKVERIQENIERLNLKNVIARVHDATQFIPEMEEKADVVIVDAPCSGLGVMGHKSDIKYRLLPEDIKSLSSIQKSIIDVAVKYVKRGGKLVYSTCTISNEENTMQKEYILNNYTFEIVKIANEKYKDRDDLQLIPGIDMSDGFYIVVLEKK